MRQSTTAPRWVTQTKTGGGDVPPEERGDCVAACIASILAVPLDSLENCHGENWWKRLQASTGRHGYGVVEMDIRYDPPDGLLWIASVPSLNLPVEPSGKIALHCIVVRGREFVHDPALGPNKYDPWKWVAAWNDGQVEAGWALTPLDPVELAA